MNYKKDFIANVICKFNFEEIKPELFTNIENSFWEAASARYSDRKVRGIEQRTIKYENNMSVTDVRTIPLFEYTNEKIRLILGHDNISFECNSYIGFEDLRTEIKENISTLCRITEINKFSRLGLRYVNKHSTLQN